jgi:hypothetical protein
MAEASQIPKCSLATFLSERMDFESCSLVHPVYFNDYSSFGLK